MGSGYLIDTNVIIDFFGGKLPQHGKSVVREAFDQIPNVSVITKIELLSTNKDIPLLVSFIEDARIFNLSQEIVDRTIVVRRKVNIKIPDAIIAGTSLVNNFTLLTRNTRDFEKVDDLKFINPYEI